MSQSRDNTAHALLVCGLWLQVGFIGATALAVGMRHLFNDGPGRARSTTLAICGAALAMGGWRRGRIVLERGATPPRIAAIPSEARS